ncbi:MAG: MmcB family DNA repair protein [Anaerolineales bacterium]|nr:MmcB family DNA repair protein [Chloroflexota bacterium]MBL6982737.1 MmcB family DNA repair protein [Anaerolineales bacterium]
MSNRIYNKQSEHDGAVRAAGQIYRKHGKHAWINPNGEKNKSWSGRYIDVIAGENQQATSAWVIEIETDDSVNDTEARSQWKDYSEAYSQRWYLAVPSSSKTKAEQLLQKHGITNCTVITWASNQNGTHTFWGLPGLK